MGNDLRAGALLMPADQYKDIVKRHRPAGYKLTERMMEANYGLTTFARSITVEPICSRFSLFTFLHECGHVHSRHIPLDGKIPAWREEYEADQYAIKAMRAEGVPVPRAAMVRSRAILHDLIKKANDDIDTEVMRYVYGKNWRSHQ